MTPDLEQRPPMPAYKPERSNEGIARAKRPVRFIGEWRRGLKIEEVRCCPPSMGPTPGLGAAGDLLVGGRDEEDETL
jgi:hypothetical protein